MLLSKSCNHALSVKSLLNEVLKEFKGFLINIDAQSKI